MKLLDGKKLSQNIQSNIAKEVKEFYSKYKRYPTLTVIIVGNNPASKIYVKRKEEACKKVGISSTVIHLKEDITQQELIQKVQALNEDKSVDGYFVQLPIPKHLDSFKIISLIDANKDVDGFHPYNIGTLSANMQNIVPATPLGVIEMLKYYNITIKGKNVVILGKSNIVGKPLYQIFLNEGATVSSLNSKTKDVSYFTKNADIICSATGIPNIITKNMIKKDAIVVDIGIIRNEQGKIVGDVDFENIKDICEYITPVPGGVGPMTIAMLLQNTLKVAKINCEQTF